MPISQTKRRFFSEATVSKKTERDTTVKKKILCVIGLICYLVFVGGGIGLILSMQSGLDNVEGGIGAALVGVVVAIVMVIAAAYATVGVLPIIMKVVHIFADSKVPAVICIPFDLLYIGANAALCVNAVSNMSDGDLSGVIVFAVLAVISVVALVTNIMSLSEDCYE